MRYYINERTGVTASKNLWNGDVLLFCEAEGRKDFNLRMDSLEAEYFLKDPDTKRVNEIDAETFALLRTPRFANGAPDLVDEFLIDEAAAEDWLKCLDDAEIDAIMSDRDWRETWLDPERVELAQEIALAEHSDITAWLEKHDYKLSDADKIRLIIATGAMEMDDEDEDEEEDDEDEDDGEEEQDSDDKS